MKLKDIMFIFLALAVKWWTGRMLLPILADYTNSCIIWSSSFQICHVTPTFILLLLRSSMFRVKLISTLPTQNYANHDEIGMRAGDRYTTLNVQTVKLSPCSQSFMTILVRLFRDIQLVALLWHVEKKRVALLLILLIWIIVQSFRDVYDLLL